MGWIGVDLDGTLAEYHGWVSKTHIGPPIPLMLARVRVWLAAGQDVRIMTARAEHPESIAAINDWCLKHLRVWLPITNKKDRAMDQLWDDRAIQVVPNTGVRVDGVDDASPRFRFRGEVGHWEGTTWLPG